LILVHGFTPEAIAGIVGRLVR